MRYITNKSYTQMISEIIEERNKREASEEDIKNAKNTLKSILSSLGMESVLSDKRYVHGNKKVLPIHFQILCYVLLMENRSKKEDFVYKIKNQQFDLITEDEINEFEKKIECEFDKWFDYIEYTGQLSDDKVSRKEKKRELDEKFLDIEREMIEDGTAEYIETVDEFYPEDEAEYLKLKFDIRTQKNIFIMTMHDKLFYLSKIFKMVFKLEKTVLLEPIEILGIRDMYNRIVLLKDYNSSLVGTVPMDKNYIDRNNTDTFDMTFKEKAFLLNLLYDEIQKLFILMEKTKESFINMQKKNILQGEYWGGDHSDEIELIWNELKNMNK